jgi:hypothetical protein
MYLNEYKIIGGATYGMMSATWPFATLKVNQYQLDLNISMFGNLHFRRSDIISIEPYGRGFTNGIRINHMVGSYKSTVVFKSLTDGDEILQQIRLTGFLDNKLPLPPQEDALITNLQSKGGFAMKIPAAIILVVIWNLLLIPRFNSVFVKGQPFSFGWASRLDFLFFFTLFLLLIISQPVRRLILKEGRTRDDIDVFSYFIMFILGIFLLTSFVTG